jgi:hypothetical protein
MTSYLDDLNRIEVYNGSEWGAVGTILQVVSAVKTDTFSTTSTSFTGVTGLSATITPSSTASKILVLLDANISITNGVTGIACFYRITGGNSTTFVGGAAGNRIRSLGAYGVTGTNASEFNFGSRSQMKASGVFLDSPATTSATTYQMQVSTSANTVFINRSGEDTDNASLGRGASSITGLEVAG